MIFRVLIVPIHVVTYMDLTFVFEENIDSIFLKIKHISVVLNVRLRKIKDLHNLYKYVLSQCR